MTSHCSERFEERAREAGTSLIFTAGFFWVLRDATQSSLELGLKVLIVTQVNRSTSHINFIIWRDRLNNLKTLYCDLEGKD